MIFQTFEKRQRVLDITKLLRNVDRLEKWKFICELFDYLYVLGPSFHHWRQEKVKVQVPQQNEILNLYCTVLGLISKNGEYNPE